jgi:hypothetical protein
MALGGDGAFHHLDPRRGDSGREGAPWHNLMITKTNNRDCAYDLP